MACWSFQESEHETERFLEVECDKRTPLDAQLGLAAVLSGFCRITSAAKRSAACLISSIERRVPGVTVVSGGM